MALWGPKIKKVPPPLDLMPQEMLVLAEAMLDYPTALAKLCSCQAQLHWSLKYFSKQKEPERLSSIRTITWWHKQVGISARIGFIVAPPTTLLYNASL